MSWQSVIKSIYSLIDELKRLGEWDGEIWVNCARLAILDEFNKSPEEWAALSSELKQETLLDFNVNHPDLIKKKFKELVKANAIWFGKDFFRGSSSLTNYGHGTPYHWYLEILEEKEESTRTDGTDAALRERFRRD